MNYTLLLIPDIVRGTVSLMSGIRNFTHTVRKTIVLTLFLMISTLSVLAQGAWDITYIPLDSLSPALLGEEVRIDFKSSVTDTLQGEVKVLSIRRLLSQGNTVSIVLAGESIQFKESWKLYVDHGVLKEQTLECVGNTGDERMYIREMHLVSIYATTLALGVLVCQPSGAHKELILINRSDVKGLLLRM